MQNACHRAARRSGKGGVRPAFRKLIRDDVRKSQRRRIRHLQKQDCDTQGKEVWRLARELAVEIPTGMRRAVTVPSWRVFAAILAMFRCLATLKKAEGPILVLELSAKEIAEKVGYSRSTVQAALRWLCDDPIHVWGVWVASGLGILNRKKRFAMAMFDGQPAPASITSTIHLTLRGKILLHLIPGRKEKTQPPQRRRQRRKTKQERAVEDFRKHVKQGTAHAANSNAEETEEEISAVDLRPLRDDVDGRAAVMAQLEQCLNFAFMKPKANAIIFPSADAFKLFQPRQQEQFFKLVAKMTQDQQALTPAHVRRIQV